MTPTVRRDCFREPGGSGRLQVEGHRHKRFLERRHAGRLVGQGAGENGQRVRAGGR